MFHMKHFAKNNVYNRRYIMNKQNFMLTLNKWKQEKNLARLVYRIIKFEDEENELSYEQICNRAKKFIYTKKDFAAMEAEKNKEIENFKINITKRYKAKGYTNIVWDRDGLHCKKDGQHYFTFFIKQIGDIERKYNKMIYSDGIKKAIEIVLNAKWIEEVQLSSNTKYRAIK